MELKLRVSENNVLRALKYLARHHELRERVIGSPMPWSSTLREGITFLKGPPPAMVCALFMYFDLTCQGALRGMIKTVQACGIRLPGTIVIDQLAVHLDHEPRTHTTLDYEPIGTFVENSMHLLEEFSSQRGLHACIARWRCCLNHPRNATFSQGVGINSRIPAHWIYACFARAGASCQKNKNLRAPLASWLFEYQYSSSPNIGLNPGILSLIFHF